MAEPLDGGPARRYLTLALGTALLALAGYAGYVVYPRFDVPAGAGAGLLLLAAGAGVASFFSPCSFPLLVTMLARPLGDQARAQEGRPLRSAVRFASALSAGAATFLIGTGAVIAVIGGGLFADVTFTSAAGRIIRLGVGLLLIALGLIQLNRLPVDLRLLEPAMHRYLRRQARVRRERPLLGFGLFGFGYLLAGFG